MEISTLFLHIAIMLLAGKLLGEFFAKVGIPAVLGEVTAGVIIGQSVLGLISLEEAIKVLAELGIILLLFEVGLEADLHMLIKTGLWSFLAATVGAVLPFIGGFVISYYFFDQDILTSLFIGGALTATSIGITIRVLTDLGKHKDRFAQIVLGAAVLDDILGVVVLAALYEFSKTKEVHMDATLNLIFHIALFFIFAPILANILARLISFIVKYMATLDFVPPSIMALILFFAYLAHKVGSPEILGSFTAGLALSRRFTIPFATFLRTDEKLLHKIEESIKPLVWTLTPIFFVSVGLALNLKAIDFSSLQFWAFSLSLIGVAIVGKVLCGFVVMGIPLREKFSIGFSMMPRGEVGLIFAEFGRSFKILDDVNYAVIVFVVAVTTFLAPIMLKITTK